MIMGLIQWVMMEEFEMVLKVCENGTALSRQQTDLDAESGEDGTHTQNYPQLSI